MNLIHRFGSFIVAGAAFFCVHAARSADPAPVPLHGATSIAIVSKRCGNLDSTKLRIDDLKKIDAIAKEFEILRESASGIYAAIVTCSVNVTFYKHDQRISSFDVFSCNALESAPVSGKRYYTYKRGLNYLPALRALVGSAPRSQSCR
jgi:hypothetical protein